MLRSPRRSVLAPDSLEPRLTPAVDIQDGTGGVLFIRLDAASDQIRIAGMDGTGRSIAVYSQDGAGGEQLLATRSDVFGISVSGTGATKQSAAFANDAGGDLSLPGTLSASGVDAVTFGDPSSFAASLYRASTGISVANAANVSVAAGIQTDNGPVSLTGKSGISLIGGSINSGTGKQKIATDGNISTDAGGTDITCPEIEITAGNIGSGENNTLSIFGSLVQLFKLRADSSSTNADQYYEVFDQFDPDPSSDPGPGEIAPNRVNAGTGTVHLFKGRFVLDSNDGLGNLSTLDLSIRDGTNDEPELDLHGHDETIGGLTGGGSVRNSGAASALTLGAAGTDQVFSGLIEGPLSLIKTGGGAFTLASEANITGTALVNAGMLIANSKLTATEVAAGDAGTLSGSGSVAANVALQSGGTLAPGTPSAPGSLSTRSLQFQSGSRLKVRAIDIGANQYDRVQAAGTVTIAAGAQLEIAVGTTPIPLGTTFRIIDNDGTTDAVNGTFQGLPEGGTLTASNRLFRISYRGGDGNDVVLTAVPNTPPAISDITDRIVALGASTGSIPFTVGDAETLADDLAVSASSDNGTLVPAAAIQLGGSGANRTITVIPAAGQGGTAVITVRVTDGGGLVAIDTFTLTAADITPPSASLGAANVTNTNQPSPYVFTVQYADPSGLNAVSFGANNVSVSAPGGALQSVTFVGTDPGGGGSPRTATYSIVPPGGAWNAPDNGTYAIRSGAAGVRDTAGNAIPAGILLGTFTVSISSPGMHSPRIAVAGSTDGTALVMAPDGAGMYSTIATVLPFGPLNANLRTAISDVNGDGTEDLIAITGPGAPTLFAAVSGLDHTTLLIPPQAPFRGSEDFSGGGYVSAADLDGDGRSEVVLTPDVSGGPRVLIYSLLQQGLVERVSFLGIEDPDFRGGARTALGDLDADGTPDLAVAAGFGGGPRTVVFNGAGIYIARNKLVADFNAFPGPDATNLRNGSYLALGDLDGDGFAELISGGGPGGAPRVQILDGQLLTGAGPATAQASPFANFFFDGNLTDRGGIRVGTANADGDSRSELVLASGQNATSRIRIHRGINFTTTGEPVAGFQDLILLNGAALADGIYVG